MMQYPPQEPANQPYYAPSEIYQYDQPQTGMQPAPVSVNEITRPVAAIGEIAIYPDRKVAILLSTLMVICLLIVILILPAVAILGASIGEPLKPSDLTSLIVIIPGVAFVGWLTWRVLSTILFPRKPIMLINREGITVSRVPMYSGFFIPWAEVAVIFPSRYVIYKHLCILPKNTPLFLARFNGFERFLRQMGAAGGSPITLRQTYLGKPAEEIIRQLYSNYANELSYYNVQVRL